MSASTHPSITGQIGYNDTRKSASPENVAASPEVHGQIDRVFENIRSLDGCIALLRERVGCVLTPQPGNPIEGVDPPSAARSDIANRLDSINQQISNLRDRIIVMTQNLEI